MLRSPVSRSRCMLLWANESPACGHALAVLLLILLTGACARVPQQAVILSRVVGNRIADVQASHEGFVTAYFHLTRQRIDDFLVQRWTPVFLANFVRESELMDKLESVQTLSEADLARLTAEL